jgi:hypothetical protein
MGNLLKELITFLRVTLRRAGDPNEPASEQYAAILIDLNEQIKALDKFCKEYKKGKSNGQRKE